MKRCSWGCHTCGLMSYGWFVLTAMRKSIRHERAVHGFSVYDGEEV